MKRYCNNPKCTAADIETDARICDECGLNTGSTTLKNFEFRGAEPLSVFNGIQSGLNNTHWGGPIDSPEAYMEQQTAIARYQQGQKLFVPRDSQPK